MMITGRRGFISGLSLAILGLSGCFGVNSGETTDISISNEASNTITASIQVTQLSDDTRLLEETVTIDVNDTKEYDEVVSGSQVEVHVGVQDGPENTSEWSDGESDAEGLYIDINDDSITFSPFVR